MSFCENVLSKSTPCGKTVVPSHLQQLLHYYDCVFGGKEGGLEGKRVVGRWQFMRERNSRVDTEQLENYFPLTPIPMLDVILRKCEY